VQVELTEVCLDADEGVNLRLRRQYVQDGRNCDPFQCARNAEAAPYKPSPCCDLARPGDRDVDELEIGKSCGTSLTQDSDT